MKKTWLFTILAVVVATAVGIYLKVRSWAKQIDYGVADGVQLEQLSYEGIKVLLPIWIYNPAPFDVVFSNLNLRIYFNDYYVSTIHSKKNYKIASKQNSTYPIMVTLDPKATLHLLAEQGQIIDEKNWLEKVTVRVEGSVDMDFGLLRINNYDIELVDSLKSYVG
jgi:LEA14-like dessication related protein